MWKFDLGDLGAHEGTEQEALFLEELPLQELYGGLLFILRKFGKVGGFGWFQYKSDAAEIWCWVPALPRVHKQPWASTGSTRV